MMNKKSGKQLQVFCLLALIVFFSGCHPGIKEDIKQFRALKKLAPQNYPVFKDTLSLEGLLNSIDQSLTYFKRVPLERKYQYGNEVYTAAHMITSLEIFKHFVEKKPSFDAVNEFIKSGFSVYEAVGNKEGDVLFTGYFEPTYDGSLQKSEAYPVPVYSKPDDLLEIDLSAFSDQYKGQGRLKARIDDSTKTVVPYYSREQINTAEGFSEESDPIVWLKNRIDRFFLEIQGSGKIILDQGGVMRVHYAGSNGNAYRSIGRYLIDKKEILKENMSMQAIRTWLEFNPERLDEVLHHNESFVFFQKEEGGPYGSLGVEVTALRSIATDRKLFPKGALCFVESLLPDKIHINPLKEWEKKSFFVLNQDTGGAIKGPARADIFCGNGLYAQFVAGHMNKYGKLFFLVLKPGRG